MAKDHTFELTGVLSEDGSTLEIHHHKMLKRLRKWSVLFGDVVEVTIKKHRKIRSNRQNRYMWGVCVPCVRAWMRETSGEDHEPEEVYAWLRTLLGHKPQITEIEGTEIMTMTGKRFSQMTTKEFAEAINEIQRIMDEKGCYIPDPNEENFLTDHLKDE